MPTLTVLLLLCLHIFFASTADITFKNVSFRGYSMYTEKFKKLIPSSNKLLDFLPKTVFDKIEFIDQKIPIIYENALADLKDLDELAIENCDVYEIKAGALKNVPFLRRLSLKGNKLEEIKQGVFNDLDISVLDLSKNFIATIDDGAFNDMPSLLHINLADNSISIWHKNWFKDTPLLSRISMQNNSIKLLPNEAFENLKGVKMFGKVNLNVNLVFSYNKISLIQPKAFKGLTSIHNLWLDHNELENFDETLLDNIKIDDLRLDHNKINCFRGSYEKVFKAKSTHIDSNPLDCNCLDSIKSYVKNNTIEVDFFFAEMDCTTERIRKKMGEVERRLKDMASIGNDEEVVSTPNTIFKQKPIK